MKHLLLFFFYFFLSKNLFSQHSIRIVDLDNSPISYVYCYSSDGTVKIHSNFNGELTFLKSIESTCFTFEKIGYHTQKVCLDTLKSNYIVLKANVLELEEVNVQSKVDFKSLTVNKTSPIVENLIGFQNTSLKGIQFCQFISKSDFLKFSKITDLKIHASKSNTILNIYFLASDILGNPLEKINKEVIVLEINQEGWNKLNISQFNLKIPEYGLFIAYEIFEKEIVKEEKFQGVLSGCPISNKNIYPLLRKDTLSNLWIPLTNLSGDLSANLAFTIDVLTTQKKIDLIKMNGKTKELNDKKIEKTFKKFDYEIEEKKVELPNNTIENLLESTLKLLSSKNVNYLMSHFFYLQNKNKLIEFLTQVKNENWANEDLYYATLIIETAFKSLKQQNSNIYISEGYHNIPVQINYKGINYNVIIKLKYTEEGWKYLTDDKLINKN